MIAALRPTTPLPVEVKIVTRFDPRPLIALSALAAAAVLTTFALMSEPSAPKAETETSRSADSVGPTIEARPGARVEPPIDEKIEPEQDPPAEPPTSAAVGPASKRKVSEPRRRPPAPPPPSPPVALRPPPAIPPRAPEPPALTGTDRASIGRRLDRVIDTLKVRAPTLPLERARSLESEYFRLKQRWHAAQEPDLPALATALAELEADLRRP